MRNDFRRLLDFAKCNTSVAELQKQFPDVTKGRFKLRDGGGLFLLVEPTGSRGWRFFYNRPGTKKPNTISFGSFPEITLAEARERTDSARELLAHGVDPAAHRIEVQRTTAATAAVAVTFSAFTNFENKNSQGEIVNGPFWQFAYVDEKSRVSGQAKTMESCRCVKIRLRTLQSALGHLEMQSIQSSDILAVLDRLSRKGQTNKAKLCQQLATRIFDLAVARGVCKYNVAAPCKNAIAKHVSKKMPALTDNILEIGLAETEARVGELIRRIRSHRAGTNIRSQQMNSLVVRRALEMMALTFPRPHNIVGMRWDEIKGDMWAIGSSKMKMRKPHKVALSRQAMAILDEMREFTGNGPRVFPTTKNTLTRALAKIGYNTDTEQSTHGLRSVASTLLNESELFSEAAIELQLAHRSGGKRDRSEARTSAVAGIYNKAERMDERKRLLQWWADNLDRLAGSNVVQLMAAE